MKRTLMKTKCYNCGIELNAENETVEHIPAQNLYAGYNPAYKQNRITVPACFKCNNGFSHIDDEIRNFIGIGNDDLTQESVITQKAVRAIMRKSNWTDRATFDTQGNVRAIDFSYDDLKTLHVKHFKGLFCNRYKMSLPSNYRIEIIADGDEDLSTHAQVFYDLLTSQNEQWEVSGHGDIFKYIMKAVTLDYETGKFEKSETLENATFIGGIMVYHEKVAVIVLAATEEYLEANKGQYGY